MTHQATSPQFGPRASFGPTDDLRLDGDPLATPAGVMSFFRDAEKCPPEGRQNYYERLISEIRFQYGDAASRTNAIALETVAFTSDELTPLRDRLTPYEVTDLLRFSVHNKWRALFEHLIPHPNAPKEELIRTLRVFMQEETGDLNQFIGPITSICFGLQESHKQRYDIQLELSNVISLLVDKDAFTMVATLVNQPVHYEPRVYLDAILRCIGREHQAEYFHTLIRSDRFKELPIENLLSFYKQARSCKILHDILERSPIFPQIEAALEQEARFYQQLLALVIIFVVLVILSAIIALNLGIW